jgi:cobalt-zinc-cadmium efflux system protein
VAHTHAHGVADAAIAARREDSRRRMLIALAINVVMLVAEAVGGFITGSLALLADAGHVLSDVGAIALGLIAASFAARGGGAQRTFGLQRAEVLAGLLNGVALVAISIWIAVEAIGRFSDPVELDAAPVLALGAFGLAGNVIATLVLARGERGDINLEGVLRHSAADALGSVGVIVAAAVILTTGWEEADAVASLLISALVLASSWRLISEPVDVLMEAAPGNVDVDELGEALCRADGVVAVHDLHVWTVTSGFVALSAHVVVADGSDRDLTRASLALLLRDEYGIEHTTLQMEDEGEEGLISVAGT